MAKKSLASVVVLAFIASLISAATQVPPDQIERGGQWLSWTQGERATFVHGFIDGFDQGTLRACDAAQSLFGDLKEYRLGDEHHPSDMPSARCLAATEKYTKAKYIEGSGVDVSPYVGPITEFYTRYPQYRGIPFFILMKWLSDRNHKTVDELYRMALKGEIRPVR